ncbi:MAG: 23S rRNA (adenine(2030)-N(6))-methyltransferase RlmJ [Citrobacter freundii]|nr:23S rRNA (adenine(2030)-N(6))-methyltransferase RlmJ [Citrobacter freundii]
MLSYRHSYHAGNHADVLKHTVQSLIIESLKEKEKPFLYLDTHAGAGRYQLSSEHAERTGEYLEGIARIWQQDDLPAELEPYIGVVQHFNRSGQLRYYPGSPLIARQLLREQERVAKADGYQQLKAKLPPVSRRGLILIDPPYEIKSDYQAVVTGINEGYKRFATGTYALWYPVVLRQQIKRMIHDLEDTGIRKILQIELAVRPDSDQRGMTASGMIVINPPWKLEQQMNNVLPWLHSKLVPAGTGHTSVSWIVPE